MVNVDLSFEKDDILNRASMADNIQRYIDILERSASDNAVSIGINSKWGTGKSYFMTMWKNKLIDDKEKVVMYDAWANDDCGSALLPFLYSIISITDDSVEDAFVEYLKNFLKIIVCETSKFGARKIFGADTELAKIIENGFEGIKDISDEKIRTVFKDFDDYYGKRQTLEDTLRQLVHECCSEGHLWIFIDDLDRCEPKFAISTLECIKHFFNIKGIVYIFGIDMEQLQNIAKNVYGTKIDTYAYLKRFFDCIYDVPDPNIEIYIKYKIEHMNLDENLKNVIKVDDICKFSRHFHCSLRDLNLILLHLEMFFNDNGSLIRNNGDIQNVMKVYYYFMIIKVKYPVQYDRIIHGDFTIGKGSPLYDELQLDNQFTKVDGTTDSLIRDIADGKAALEYANIAHRYALFSSRAESFEDHMQYFIK